MKIIKLSTQNINQIINLETRMHPPELRFSRTEWYTSLQGINRCNCNFCIGLMEKNELIGYIYSYLGSTYQSESSEKVIIIGDMVIAPEYKHHLFSLFKGLRDVLWEKNLQNLATEAITIHKVFNLLEEHEDILTELGYEIVCTYPVVTNNRNMTWIRLEPQDE